VNNLITVTFDPRNENIQRYEWDAFSSEYGLKFDDQTGKFCCDGVEAEYQAQGVTFTAAFPGLSCDDAILSSVGLWQRHGGKLSAVPEVRRVIDDVISDVMR